MRNFAFVLLGISFLTSCEKPIDVHLKDASSKLVVDASIENNKPPKVYLSHSLDYYSEISLDVLAASFIHNATVTISTGGNSYQLKEAATMADTNGNLIYYYTTDTSGPGALLGALNTAYSLKIEVGNQVYTSQTTIPPLAKEIDSLWWRTSPNNPDTTKVIVVAKVTDPPGLGNYIRYFTSQNGGPFFPGLNSVFDDQIVDGTTYEVDVDRGVNRNAEIDFNSYAFFHKGDSVVVKFCNIDKATFDFWRTMEYNYSSIGNPFSSPTTVLGNISNNALGYFGGYAAQFKSLKIPQ